MASFFNIEKIRSLLSETIDGDKAAQSMLFHGENQGFVDAVIEACHMSEIRTNTEAVRAIASGMGDYVRRYPAPPSYKQRLWDSCDSWIRRIADKLGVEAGTAFEDELPRPVARDIGVDLIKALHDEKGKTKEELAEKLNVGIKTIQTELRALDPSLQKSGTKIRPLRIAGQEMHPKIEVKSEARADNPHAVERKFYMKNRLHPIALQLNTQEIGTLLQALYRNNADTGSILSYEMALDVWCQLSPYGQKRIQETFGSKDGGFRDFLDDMIAELKEGRLIAFHTEEEQRGNMSMGELVMSSFKTGDACRIVLKQGGKTIRIDKARITPVDLHENRWLAIPVEEYPDKSSAVSFSTEEVWDIRW